METGHTLEWSSEENYMFKLTAFRDSLLEWIDAKPYRMCVCVREGVSVSCEFILSVFQPSSQSCHGN